jgi:hypothetical protein
MAGMGPAPKPADRRARRNATYATTALPAEGRAGPPPAWPLPTNVRLAASLESAEAMRAMAEQELAQEEPRVRLRELGRIDERIRLLRRQLRDSARLELAMWFELWRTPQAVMWERQRWTREVAQFCRLKVLAELGDLDAQKEARQVGDRIGITPLALRRLRWEVAEGTTAQQADPAAPRGSRGKYGHLRPVQPGETATGA